MFVVVSLLMRKCPISFSRIKFSDFICARSRDEKKSTSVDPTDRRCASCAKRPANVGSFISQNAVHLAACKLIKNLLVNSAEIIEKVMWNVDRSVMLRTKKFANIIYKAILNRFLNPRTDKFITSILMKTISLRMWDGQALQF